DDHRSARRADGDHRDDHHDSVTVGRLAALLAVAAVVCVGCGGGANANEVLSETAENLGEIRSGDLSLRLVVAAAGGEQVGVELAGPFAFPEGEELPLADVEVTRIAGEERTTVRFISTGERAYVEVGEETFELPGAQAERFRGARGGGTNGGGLAELRIEDWFGDAELSDGGEVGGAETDRVSARLDVVAAANDLLELARAFGGVDARALRGASADQLQRAVESATIVVHTGEDDRLLRRLAIDARLRPDVPPELDDTLGTFGRARFTLELGIANPNRPVSVEEPENAQPYPED
ncbi:MAG TPA: hypothetical protein VG079_03735, partial [Gaiellaceae bacterium]|nr:hypothetical protein [Gaiellaceae bacterium]